jgi:hypothetical protein
VTPFLLAIAAVALAGGGFASGVMFASQRIKNAAYFQKAIRAAREQGVIEGTQRRAQNLPPARPEEF